MYALTKYNNIYREINGKNNTLSYDTGNGK